MNVSRLHFIGDYTKNIAWFPNVCLINIQISPCGSYIVYSLSFHCPRIRVMASFLLPPIRILPSWSVIPLSMGTPTPDGGGWYLLPHKALGIPIPGLLSRLALRLASSPAASLTQGRQTAPCARSSSVLAAIQAESAALVMAPVRFLGFLC